MFLGCWGLCADRVSMWRASWWSWRARTVSVPGCPWSPSGRLGSSQPASSDPGPGLRFLTHERCSGSAPPGSVVHLPRSRGRDGHPKPGAQGHQGHQGGLRRQEHPGLGRPHRHPATRFARVPLAVLTMDRTRARVAPEAAPEKHLGLKGHRVPRGRHGQDTRPQTHPPKGYWPPPSDATPGTSCRARPGRRGRTGSGRLPPSPIPYSPSSALDALPG